MNKNQQTTDGHAAQNRLRGHPNAIFVGEPTNHYTFPVRVLLMDSMKEFYLPPRLDLVNHSPTGFAWGYHGSGPAQLALAILAAVSSDDEALTYYQHYKADVISQLPKDEGWKIGIESVREWLWQVKTSSPGCA